MLKETIEQEDKIIHCLTFDSVEEVLTYIENTPAANDYWGYSLSSRKNDSDFSGTNSLDEAIELCRFGKFEDVEELFKINEKLNFDVPNSLNKRKTMLSNHGFRPDVPKNIIGHPKQMHRLVRDESKKFINIYFNVSASAGTSKARIYNKGIITLKLIEMLEKLNYRVNFNFFEMCYEFCFSGKKEYFFIKINIKRFNEKLDPNICYFPICHPSFLRRIIFAVQETLIYNSGAWTSSYGKIAKYNEVKEVLNITDKDILINHADELNVYGADLFDDTANFMSNINLSEYLGNGSNIRFDERSKTFSLKMNNKKR